MSVIERRWTIHAATSHNTATTDPYYVPTRVTGSRLNEGEEIEVVPAEQLQGAVSLSDEQWERVLWWLHKPLPPGPAKALDETIIRAINSQRGQS